MKSLVIMVVGGVGLFAATVLGLLAFQGRLNHEGVKDIPLLSSLFPAPAETKDKTKDKDADAKKDGHEGTNEGAHADDPAPHGGVDGHAEQGHAPSAEPSTSHGVQNPGLGKEKKLPYRLGESLFEKKKDDGHGGHGAEPAKDGHGSEPAGEHGAEASGHAATEHAKSEHGADPKKAQDPEWRRRVDSLMGQDAYERGRFFTFPKLEAGLSVQAINDILKDAREQRTKLEAERAALAQRKSELDARENDIRDRQDDVQRRIQELEQMRQRLEQEIKEAHGTVMMIRQSELSRWKENAQSLAALGTQKAGEVIMEWWKTEEGQDKALRLLAALDAETRDQIIAGLTTAQVREVLDRRLKTFVEPAKPGK